MKVHPKPKRNLLETILHIEILQGLAFTFRKLFSPPITRQYPQEKPPAYPGFRGQHALVRDPKTNDTRCIACMRCVTVCPSRCIQINYQTDERGARRVDQYTIEPLRCVFCGYCVEVCPVNAVTMTNIFEYASTERQAIEYDKEALLGNWDQFVRHLSPGTPSVNPLWRPRGVDPATLTAARRLQVPEDWTRGHQFIGTMLQQEQAANPSSSQEADHV